jgi:hypothetical protein
MLTGGASFVAAAGAAGGSALAAAFGSLLLLPYQPWTPTSCNLDVQTRGTVNINTFVMVCFSTPFATIFWHQGGATITHLESDVVLIKAIRALLGGIPKPLAETDNNPNNRALVIRIFTAVTEE